MVASNDDLASYTKEVASIQFGLNLSKVFAFLTVSLSFSVVIMNVFLLFGPCRDPELLELSNKLNRASLQSVEKF